MIWYIIAGSLLLICILILLAGTWEVSIVEAYYFDETGQYFVDLKDTDYTPGKRGHSLPGADTGRRQNNIDHNLRNLIFSVK